MQQQKSLTILYEELRTLQVFDRVHDYSANPDPLETQAHAVRQARRNQIMAEIKRLKPQEPKRSRSLRIGSAACVCAAGYAVLYLLLR